MTRKKLVTMGLGTAAGLGLLVTGVGVTSVAAATTTGEYPLIVQNLADKFNLKEEDVQAVFESTRTERVSLRLDEAVSDGEITEEQKQLILDKIEEMEADREEIANQSLTEDERRALMDEHREEMETWADENDIPLYLLHFGRGGMGGGMGEGRGEMRRGLEE